jgi:hypothetical protein
VDVGEGNEAAAVAALISLVSQFPEAEEVGPLAALVAGAFPAADLSALGSGLRTPGGEASATVSAAASAVTSALLDVGEARPNPATSTASVLFVLTSEARVEAALYDGLGRRVALLASGTYGAGPHALTLDGSGLPAGVYVVHVVARTTRGTEVAVRRITITR